LPPEDSQTACQELTRLIVELHIVVGDGSPMNRTKKRAVPKHSLEKVFAEARSLRNAGKKRFDIAAHIYKRLESPDREPVVAVFVVATGVTEKTALTYWYRCRQKAAKPAAKN
jgi:hypothetical protein